MFWWMKVYSLGPTYWTYKSNEVGMNKQIPINLGTYFTTLKQQHAEKLPKKNCVVNAAF